MSRTEDKLVKYLEDKWEKIGGESSSAGSSPTTGRPPQSKAAVPSLTGFSEIIAHVHDDDEDGDNDEASNEYEFEEGLVSLPFLLPLLPLRHLRL